MVIQANISNIMLNKTNDYFILMLGVIDSEIALHILLSVCRVKYRRLEGEEEGEGKVEVLLQAGPGEGGEQKPALRKQGKKRRGWKPSKGNRAEVGIQFTASDWNFPLAARDYGLTRFLICT